MAQVTTRKVVEGSTNLTLHVFLQSDGSGELENFVLVNPVDLSPAMPAAPSMRIMKIWSQLVWFDVSISYGGIVPRPVWVVARDTASHVDFRCFGGLTDYASSPPSDQNGRVLISTSGFVLGSQGSLVIEFRKS